MQIDCTPPSYLCFVNMPKGVRLVTPKFNFCVMESVKLLALSEKQIEDLRDIFMAWWKDEENSATLIEAGYETHNPVAKLFLREVADAIICDVSIMTQEERHKDTMSSHNSMERFENDRMSYYRFLEGLED